MDTLKYFYKNASHSTAKKIYSSKNNVYFILKGLSHESTATAIEYDVWGTRSSVERTLMKHYDNGFNVILIFPLFATNTLMGYALMKSRPGEYSKSKSKFSSVKFDGPLFDISWVRLLDLNPPDYIHISKYFTNVPLVNLKDGHELDKNTGYDLCRVFEKRFQRTLDTFKGFPKPLLPVPVKPNSEVSPKFINSKNQLELFPTVQKSLKLKGANVYSLDMASEFNPSLLIFPIDISNMSYDTYISLYNTSHNYWIEIPEDFDISSLTSPS
ncbi:YT521-B-like domain protein [Theileria parva strain Muguga]|uniref:YT521-B-like domain protein n=1 Tax=Theileria parva strain Muguga TaxID=333668 RepID=UPI001C618DD7|nr:YT521-B-like domain protein [Theileria parva strain Muguga]EAN32648.2 YT521-B-like domain protein [Theileria parva strain Muguga]